MGRTTPSFTLHQRWKDGDGDRSRGLLDKGDRKIFDEMFSYGQLQTAAGTIACRLVIIQTILMAIIFEDYKQLTKLATENKLKQENRAVDNQSRY